MSDRAVEAYKLFSKVYSSATLTISEQKNRIFNVWAICSASQKNQSLSPEASGQHRPKQTIFDL
ncbi:hypothetical protein EIG84_02745 [Flavobacteriaceae bacterium 14752]|nr:hypothetical protein EIG84_02745 [Flavobacteriaceae bacterium 14752]